VEYIKPQNTQSACITERKRQLGTHFFSKKNDFPPIKIKKIENKIKKCPVSRAQGWGALLSCKQGSHLRYMSVGVMEDYKLRDLRVSHTLGWSWMRRVRPTFLLS
jgi:hypothetical protein